MIGKSLQVVSLVIFAGRFQVFFIPKIHKEREGGNTHHPCVCLISAPDVLGTNLSGCPIIGLVSKKEQEMDCRRRRFAGQNFRCPCEFSEVCMILMTAIEIRHDSTLHIGRSDQIWLCNVRHAGEMKILR